MGIQIIIPLIDTYIFPNNFEKQLQYMYLYLRCNPFLMGRYNRLSIHYGYNFNILNTFKMGLFKKLCSHIPSKMDPSRPPGGQKYHKTSEIIKQRRNSLKMPVIGAFTLQYNAKMNYISWPIN